MGYNIYQYKIFKDIFSVILVIPYMRNIVAKVLIIEWQIIKEFSDIERVIKV